MAHLTAISTDTLKPWRHNALGMWIALHKRLSLLGSHLHASSINYNRTIVTHPSWPTKKQEAVGIACDATVLTDFTLISQHIIHRNIKNPSWDTRNNCRVDIVTLYSVRTLCQNNYGTLGFFVINCIKFVILILYYDSHSWLNKLWMDHDWCIVGASAPCFLDANTISENTYDNKSCRNAGQHSANRSALTTFVLTTPGCIPVVYAVFRSSPLKGYWRKTASALKR